MHIIIAIVSTGLTGINYCYLTLIIQFNIYHLFVHSEVVTGSAIKHYSFICTQLNGSKYCFVIPIILFCKKLNGFNYSTLSFICTQSNDSMYIYVIPVIQEFQVLQFNTNNFIQHYSFICIQLNEFKYCYVSIRVQLNISYLLTHNQNVKQFYF